MTVGELRKILEGVPDEMIVLTYDEGVLQAENVTAGIEKVVRLPAEDHIRVIWQHGRHPSRTAFKMCFVID